MHELEFMLWWKVYSQSESIQQRPLEQLTMHAVSGEKGSMRTNVASKKERARLGSDVAWVEGSRV